MSVAIEAGINSGQLYQWVQRYKQYGYDGLELTEVEDMDGIIEHMNKYHSPYYRIELQLEIEKDKGKVKKI